VSSLDVRVVTAFVPANSATTALYLTFTDRRYTRRQREFRLVERERPGITGLA
jgi:hypothetical protein